MDKGRIILMTISYPVTSYLYRMIHIIDDPDDATTGGFAAARGRRVGLCHRLLARARSRPSAGRAGRCTAVPHAVLFAVACRLFVEYCCYFKG